MNRLKTLAINATGFAFDPMHGESFTVSPTGMTIITELNEGSDVDAIAKKLTDEYEVDFEQAYTDVLEFINRLKRYGLVADS